MSIPEAFQKAEDEYFVLRGKLQTGRITRAEFLAAVSKLTVRDANGKTFVIDPDTGNWSESNAPVRDPGMGKPVAAARSAVPTTMPEQRRKGVNKLAIAAGIAFVLVCVMLVGIVGVYTLSRPSTTSNVRVVSTAVPVQPIAAKDFAAQNASLAAKIALMNQAQLKVIRDLRALSYNGRAPGLALPLSQGIPQTEQDIKDLAGKAMDVAVLADQLGGLAGKQDKGSAKAAQSADAYYNIAKNAFSLALDSQTVRQALQPLKNGAAPVTQAIDTIASYGAQLWNSAVTDGNTKTNPFTAQTKNGGEAPTALNPNAASQVQSQTNANNASIYIAQSSTQNTRTINVPAAQSPVSNPYDPQVLKSLTTADGQSDANKSQQVAAANLQRLGATSNSSDPSKPSQLQVPTSPVAVSGSDQIKAGNLPSYKSGKATVISRNQSTDDNAFMNSLGLNGDQPPTDQGKTDVQDAPALVSLNITNITIDQVNKRAPGSGSFEADVNFSFTVNWTTNLASPQFKLSCNSHNEATITQASGALAQKANGLLIIYPGTLTVYCYANSSNGQALGSTSVNVLVGDADGATQRAYQVETDSASLNATLTAEAVGTANTQGTQTVVAADKTAQSAGRTAEAAKTINALETEVAADKTAEFKLTAAAFATKQAQPPPATVTPSVTPTFKPTVVDNVFHAGNVFGVNTKVVLQRGRLYRFSFSGRVNLINPTRSVTANQLPEHVNGVAVPASGIVVIQGNGSTASITCGSGEPDPKDPGGYNIVVEDLGPS